MASVYLIVSFIVFPVLALCWLVCIVCCVYKSIVKNLAKAGRTTRIQVLVSDRRDSDSSSGRGRWTARRTSTAASTLNSQQRGAHMPGAMPDVEDDTTSVDFRGQYGPVVHIPQGLKQSLEAQGKSLNDSLGPVYYPKYPQSQHGTACETPERRGMSPMTPLQPPWPHLPPIAPNNHDKKKVPTSVRSFLESQR